MSHAVSSEKSTFTLTMVVTPLPGGLVGVEVDTDPCVGDGLALQDMFSRVGFVPAPGTYVFTQKEEELEVEYPSELSAMKSIETSEIFQQLMSDGLGAFLTFQKRIPTQARLTEVARKILMRLMVNQCTESLRAEDIRVLPVCRCNGDGALGWQDSSLHPRFDQHMESLLSDRPITCSAGKASVWAKVDDDGVAEVRIGLIDDKLLFNEYFNSRVSDMLRLCLIAVQVEVAQNAAIVVRARHGDESSQLERLVREFGPEALINMSLFKSPMASSETAEA
jgi:hypothetical protein